MSIVAINKPKGITSHDVVNRVRKITGIKRVGHGGTLDPLATGVLVVAIGREFTKQLDQFVKGEKEYLAKICLGFHSTTDDFEGEKTQIVVDVIPDSNTVKNVVESFIGDIQQTPPNYSSIKLSGVPAHRRMRRRENISLKSREVKIYDIQTISYQYPYLELKVTTGPGVYIRALARDIGEKLKTGGYLAELQRTKVAEYTLNKALTLEEFEEQYNHSRSQLTVDDSR
ncbi:MAG TPA: tRNA pseudouridine(55) synthase TruB [Candidatus Levybacteria bacterium]|nr:tRNA pseudouridine(55) synthase TruB [Candidatus Levybacteria bacterium]